MTEQTERPVQDSYLHISSNISLGLVLLLNILINITQNKLHRLLEVGHIPHLKLGTISQEEDHISISKQSLDRSDLGHIGVDNLCHVLSVDAGGDSDTTVGDLISDPCLTGPCCGGEGGSRFGGSKCGFASLSLTALGLGSTSSHLLNSVKSRVGSFNNFISNERRVIALCHESCTLRLLLLHKSDSSIRCDEGTGG